MRSSTAERQSISSTLLGSLSIRQPAAALLATIVAESNIGPMHPWIREHGTSVNQLLHHFSNNSAVIMGSEVNSQFWDLVFRYNFLVSTMLAVSASHLGHYTANPAAHHIAELGQQSSAISALKPVLGLPLHKERADALLCAAVMLNAVSFAFVENLAPSTSWVFSDSTDRLGWLDLQMQFKKLEDATAQFRDNSFLQDMIDATHAQDDNSDDDGEDATLKNVPEAWKMLIGDKDAPNHNIYYELVRAIADLRILEPTCLNSLGYLGFVGKLEEDFRDLLFEKDHRALWIFGYWLGLMGRLGIWWCNRRVERDRAAVQVFLEQKGLRELPGKEGAMWKALITDLGTVSEWPSPAATELKL
jgi:hypothetical protein